MLMLVRREERNCPSAAVLAVELPGLEPLLQTLLSCENAEFDDAKVRETTRRDLRIHRKVLTASTRRDAPGRYRDPPDAGDQSHKNLHPANEAILLFANLRPCDHVGPRIDLDLNIDQP
jgi:hypothetical protein